MFVMIMKSLSWRLPSPQQAGEAQEMHTAAGEIPVERKYIRETRPPQKKKKYRGWLQKIADDHEQNMNEVYGLWWSDIVSRS